MYKVILVDDEIWSLEGLSKLFKWEKMGFTVTAQLTDATEAYDLICETKPDVVFTDIRMPEISGIELLTKSRNHGSSAEFVIVSGFAEFSYAKEALRYGAFDYHLKPIDPEEADLLLERLKNHLDEKQLAINRSMYKDLTSGLYNPLDMLQTWGMKPSGEAWQVLAVIGNEEFEWEASFFPNMNHMPLKIAKNKTFVIFNEIFNSELLSGWTERHSLSIGISSVSTDIDDISRLIREADMAALNDFVHKSQCITKYSSGNVIEIERTVRNIEKLIMSRNWEEISTIIDRIPNLFKKHDLGIYHATCMWNQLAVIFHKRLDCDSVAAKINFVDYEELYTRFGNVTALCEFLKELINQISNFSESGAAKTTSYNENFIALLDYVNKNYVTELTLSELAERFYLNMSYCSELFKKVTSYTFTDYVTKLRMEKAAELIQSGIYTIEKVYDMIGYNDYYYFCKIFKKFHGVTPSQFSGKLSKF